MKSQLCFLLSFFLIGHLIYAQPQNNHGKINLSGAWEFKQKTDSVWRDAIVPGTVHRDLLNNSLIPDPFVGLNEKEVQWIEKCDWEYRTEFNLSEAYLIQENIELNLNGLDTYADVYLNDSLILQTNNMFRRWRSQVGSLLKAQNELRIYFHSPITENESRWNRRPYTLPASNDQSDKKVSVYIRKAPYHFGWDWGPRLVTSGIWRDVFLSSWNELIIRDFAINVDSVPDTLAYLTASIEIEAHKPGKYICVIEKEGQLNQQFVFSVLIEENLISQTNFSFTVTDFKRWWPNGLGNQHIEKFYLKIYDASSENDSSKNLAFDRSEVIDSAQTSQGIRTIELVQKEDKIGRGFYFKVNDVPVFMKGANYIPSQNFVPRAYSANIRHVLYSAQMANMNMIRVWGGGIYESNEFYSICDSLGLLVWQDFMFACSMYPGEEEFINNVKEEAIDNVKRLRSHPSIALWCGNNESNVAWHNWGWQGEYKLDSEAQSEIYQDYQKLFMSTLPEVVREFGGRVDYIHTSPLSNWGKIQNFDRGNMHYWGVWHGNDAFDGYKKYIPRFMSEYGFQSFPDLDVVKSFSNPEDWNLDSEVMKWHQKSYKGNGMIEKFRKGNYLPAKDFPSFLYLSQLIQADGMKIAFESHRTSMPRCMGTLYWQLNDCWPGPSWSGIDYLGTWKATHYAAKRAFKDIIVVPIIDDHKINIDVVSERLTPISAKTKVSLRAFSGQTIWSKNIQQRVLPNHVTRLPPFSLRKELKVLGLENVFLQVQVHDSDSLIAENLLYFTPPAELALLQPTLKHELYQSEEGVKICLNTDYLAKNVYIDLEDIQATIDDNFFDLLPGSEKCVSLKFPKSAHSLADIQSRLTITHLLEACKPKR